MERLSPAVLGREHGLSAQAVRNYERDGFLPPAERTPGGYRIYTPRHAAALRAYLTLITAYGYATAGQVMTALHDGEPDRALVLIDRGHAQALRDRETLDTVRTAIGELPSVNRTPGRWTIGDLARRLGVTAATLRAWESAGILSPARQAGYRVYGPDDIRDAELAHLLRRGHYPLGHIATVVREVRSAGGTDELAAALTGWQERLTARGLAMLDAAARLSDYLHAAS